jgi:molecular chaperone GrpE (heat shock protein)
MPDPTLPPGTVARVEQKGYRIGDELLRPARVLVTPL